MSGGMGKERGIGMRLDEKKWQKLVIAFRDQPGNYKNAGREALCDRATAKKAWLEGSPAQGRKPIKEMVEEEQERKAELARVKAEAIRTETDAFAASLRGDVRQQALEEYERTNRYLRAASATATATLVATHRLQPVVQELGAMGPQLIEMIHKDLGREGLSAVAAMGLLERIAAFTKSVAAAAYAATQQGAKVFEVSRARTSSDALINIEKAVNVEPFDPAEAKRLAAELAEAALEMEAGEDGPVLNVIEGQGGAA